MEIVDLSKIGLDESVAKAASVLRAGGVVLYPTDTLYGLGADAFSDEAVAKVYAIKGRDENKPIHCIVPDLDAAQQYADVNFAARELAQRFLPGPLTLVLAKKAHIDSGIGRNIPTIGIRIPDNDFCLKLAAAFGPYTTTSANVAGAPNVRCVADILAQLGTRASMIDLIVDGGTLPEREPSTVIDLSSGAIRIVREGAIRVGDLHPTGSRDGQNACYTGAISR